jgi:hypothetical protein
VTTKLVVHVKRAPYDLYVGRPAKETPYHYGNPFSNRPGTKAAIVVDDPVAAFEAWLEGTAFQSLEPERRRWILDSLPELAGKVLACWCVTPENPQADCHGWVLANWARRAALIRATYRTDYTPFAQPDRFIGNGTRGADGQHMICTLGDPRQAQRLAAQLQEIRWITGGGNYGRG